MSNLVTSFILSMQQLGGSLYPQWGCELAAANKYDFGDYEQFSWLSNAYIAKAVERTPSKFTVPANGKLLITFGDFMVVHICAKGRGVRTRYAIANKEHFSICALEQQSIYRENKIGAATPWTKNTNDFTDQFLLEKTGELFNLTGNILLTINRAFINRRLQPNANIIKADFSRL